ncbi:hypothetical protein [Candidatus Binatus sp.]|uniref:hypothetical protein n=1 Tax=Candidatus Binatus sp. TaxID=2811406 RepID=UPI003BC09FC2
MTAYMRSAAAVLVLWSACFAGDAQANTETTNTPGLEIALSTSRPQVTVGALFGIVADVKNISDKDLYLVCAYFVMVPPIEIDPNGPEDWWAFINGNQPTDDFKSDKFYFDPIRLPSGDKMVAMWAGTNSHASSDTTWEGALYSNFNEFAHIATFLPGDYTIKVAVLYWPDQLSAQSHAPNYRTQTADIKVSISAPQWVIMSGAAVGAVIAYFLFPNIRRKPNEIDVLGLLSAVLLGVIITILLARISDTQFFVKITVNDLWGAIAIGFIAVASGNSLLNKYVASWGSPTGATSGTSATTTTHE